MGNDTSSEVIKGQAKSLTEISRAVNELAVVKKGLEMKIQKNEKDAFRAVGDAPRLQACSKEHVRLATELRACDAEMVQLNSMSTSLRLSQSAMRTRETVSKIKKTVAATHGYVMKASESNNGCAVDVQEERDEINDMMEDVNEALGIDVPSAEESKADEDAFARRITETVRMREFDEVPLIPLRLPPPRNVVASSTDSMVPLAPLVPLGSSVPSVPLSPSAPAAESEDWDR